MYPRNKNMWKLLLLSFAILLTSCGKHKDRGGTAYIERLTTPDVSCWRIRDKKREEMLKVLPTNSWKCSDGSIINSQ